MEGEMKTINTTVRVPIEQVNKLDSWLRQSFEVIDYKILPNTEKLYETDETFKKLVKMVKKAQRERDKYINEHNYKT